jgi:hypothetical protein
VVGLPTRWVTENDDENSRRYVERFRRLPDFDQHARAAGLTTEHRFATWDLRPWRAGAPFAVSVLRR